MSYCYVRKLFTFPCLAIYFSPDAVTIDPSDDSAFQWRHKLRPPVCGDWTCVLTVKHFILESCMSSFQGYSLKSQEVFQVDVSKRDFLGTYTAGHKNAPLYLDHNSHIYWRIFFTARCLASRGIAMACCTSVRMLRWWSWSHSLVNLNFEPDYSNM